MDAPERDPAPHPPGGEGKAATKQEKPISVHDAAPRSSTVLPFSRRNDAYSSGPAKAEEDLLLGSEKGDDPGPRATS